MTIYLFYVLSNTITSTGPSCHWNDNRGNPVFKKMFLIVNRNLFLVVSCMLNIMIFKNHGQGNILFQLCRIRILFSFQSVRTRPDLAVARASGCHALQNRISKKPLGHKSAARKKPIPKDADSEELFLICVLSDVVAPAKMRLNVNTKECPPTGLPPRTPETPGCRSSR